MLTEHLPRILLVEDEPHVHNTLLRRLANDGYSVTLATSYLEARRILVTNTIHVAVIDLCLDTADETNLDGVRLLEDINTLGLRDIMPCIVTTAYGTVPLVLKSMDLGVARFIPKQPGSYINELRRTIREQFDNVIKIRFDIDYIGDSHALIEQGAREIHEAEADWPAPEFLIPQIYDLLGKIFYRARQLWVKNKVKGLSGSIVLEVHPTWETGLGQSWIVKIGRRDKTREEEQNYQEHVEHHLPRNHATQLDACYARHLGGLLYTLADTEAVDTMSFETFFLDADRPPSDVTRALRRLFRETCRLWYQNHSALDNVSLRDLYYEAFNLAHQADRLFNEVRRLRPGLDEHAPTLHFDSLDIDLPNPLHWLSNGNATVLPVRKCITHGDLNAKNILMNQTGDCWLIDFYRTYRSHILRDFVVLETDLKFRLMPTLTPSAFLEIEQTLARLEHPQDGIALDADLPVYAQKAAVVIVDLRAEAWRLLDTTKEAWQIQREYLISLLMATLNVLRLRHFKEEPELQPRRELALLSAAVICDQLQRLH